MASSTSPTQRTLAALRKEGYLPAVVEKFNHHTKTRSDLYGLGDVLAIRHDGTVLVQCTSGSNGANRVAKALGEGEANLRAWLAHDGRRFFVHAWRKLKGRGRQQWFVRKTEIVVRECRLLVLEDTSDA